MIEQFERLLAFVDEAVAGGYVLALGLVCVLQYFLHLYRLSRADRQADRYREEMSVLEDDFRSVQRDRTLSRLENSILREFVTQTEIRKALELMMRRFVPNVQEGFAAFLRYGADCPAECEVYQSRGLSEESCGQLRLDDGLRQRIARERVVVLEGAELRQSVLLESLSPADRRKVSRLNLAALGENDELAGILVSTSLYPPGAPREQQVELTRRLMQSVSTDFKRSQALELQTHQLRSTNEMLALRAIFDQRFDSPMAMIREFLTQLMQRLEADRAVLYLQDQSAGGPGKPLIRCGADAGGREIDWQTLEEQLAGRHAADNHPSLYCREELQLPGCGHVAGGAIAAPLRQDEQSIGIACFSRQSDAAFDPAQLTLVSWAAEYLGETILRVLSQAIVEKYAREDGLTELANRRAFDQQIQREVRLARERQREASLLLFDLDRFKSVNDTFGHLAGDAVLRRAAQMLRDEALASVRAGDRVLVARYGGEEIAVLLSNVGMVGAHRIGESIRRAVAAETFEFDGEEIRVTMSVGIATCPDHADNVDELIAAADAALYEAKQSGRNRAAVGKRVQEAEPV